MRVSGISGAKFRFISYVRYANGNDFVELIGGRRGGAKMRYIHPDRVIPIRRRTTRRATAAR